MSVATASVIIAAASVIAASIFYSFQIRNQTRIRKADLVMRLYATFDSLDFQEAFHRVYWADFHDYDSVIEILEGKRYVGTYLLTFYDQVGVLLSRGLIDFDLVDALLGNSTRQLWEKVAPVVEEARTRSDDARLYEYFEYLYGEMTSRPSRLQRRTSSAAISSPARSTASRLLPRRLRAHRRLRPRWV